MIKRWAEDLGQHVEENLGIYVATFLFFVLGLAIGTLGVSMLNPEQEKELLSYLNIALDEGRGRVVADRATVARILWDNALIMVWLWFVGLGVLGMPLALGTVAVKGFTVGFTISFLVEKKAVQGIALAICSVLPHNTIYVPVTIVAGANAISFSLRMVRGRTYSWPSGFFSDLSSYTMVFFLILLGGLAGGLVEAYVSPVFLRFIMNRF